MRRKILASLTVLAFLVGVGVASWIWHGHHTLRYLAEVEPGLLYRSGQPDGSQLSSVVKRYGIKTIINLRIPDRMTSDPRAAEEREAAAALGVRLVNIPSSQSPSPEILRQFFEIVDDFSSRPVLLHCSAAEVRTGALVAAYRIYRCGWTYEQALEEAARFELKPGRWEYLGFESFLKNFAAQHARSPAQR